MMPTTYTRTVRDHKGERQEVVTRYVATFHGRRATFTAPTEEAATRLALDYFKASRSHLSLYPDTQP